MFVSFNSVPFDNYAEEKLLPVSDLTGEESYISHNLKRWSFIITHNSLLEVLSNFRPQQQECETMHT
jgi:hypothetical protein